MTYHGLWEQTYFILIQISASTLNTCRWVMTDRRFESLPAIWVVTISNFLMPSTPKFPFLVIFLSKVVPCPAPSTSSSGGGFNLWYFHDSLTSFKSKFKFSFSSYPFLNTRLILLYIKTQNQLVINTSLLLTMQCSCNMGWATSFILICLWYSHMNFIS